MPDAKQTCCCDGIQRHRGVLLVQAPHSFQPTGHSTQGQPLTAELPSLGLSLGLVASTGRLDPPHSHICEVVLQADAAKHHQLLHAAGLLCHPDSAQGPQRCAGECRRTMQSTPAAACCASLSLLWCSGATARHRARLCRLGTHPGAGRRTGQQAAAVCKAPCGPGLAGAPVQCLHSPRVCAPSVSALHVCALISGQHALALRSQSEHVFRHTDTAALLWGWPVGLDLCPPASISIKSLEACSPSKPPNAMQLLCSFEPADMAKLSRASPCNLTRHLAARQDACDIPAGCRLGRLRQPGASQALSQAGSRRPHLLVAAAQRAHSGAGPSQSRGATGAAPGPGWPHPPARVGQPLPAVKRLGFITQDSCF